MIFFFISWILLTYNGNANNFQFSKVNAKTSNARIFGAKARFKNPKTKVLPLSRERMVVIKEWYGVCFPPMQFHDWKQFMFDDE